MRMVALSIILLACSVASMIMAHVEFAKLRRELANRRPDLTDWIYSYGWYAAKYQKLFAAYRSEFPGSRRVAHHWFWFIAVMVFGFSGFELLSAAFRH